MGDGDGKEGDPTRFGIGGRRVQREKKNGLGFGFSHRKGPLVGLANIGGACYCRITSGEDVLWWLFAKRLSVDQRRFRKQKIDTKKNHTQRSNCPLELRLLFFLSPTNLC